MATMREAAEALALMCNALPKMSDFQPDPPTHTLTNDEGMELPLPVESVESVII